MAMSAAWKATRGRAGAGPCAAAARACPMRAIIFAPTLIGTIYGMNFDFMPELHWTFGYPYALVLMVASSVVLFFIFKSRDWL